MTIEQDSLSRERPAVAPEAIAAIQPHGFLITLSLDWIVLRASENVHRFLGQSHVTLIGEPLGKFIQADPLHDLRNLFSRLSGTTGVARAYRVRLTDGGPRFDIAFQIAGGNVILEGVPSADQGFGEAIGSVAGLIDGLNGLRGQELLSAAARRMRALTGFARVTLDCAGEQAESCAAGAQLGAPPASPGLRLLADAAAPPVPLHPRSPNRLDPALLGAPSQEQRGALAEAGIGATLLVPMIRAGKEVGRFRCDHPKPRTCGFETYAATELFAQMVALQLEIDRLS